MYFDALAPTYDADFTATPLARALRGRVWARLDAVFAPEAALLELACGTGEDARHLAQRGVRVTATDQSAGMLAAARAKTAGLPVKLASLDLAAPALSPEIQAGAPYAGVLSNFGGLNALPRHRALAEFLAPLVPAGGRLVLVVMGRWCAWEIGWHLLHWQPRRAFRRLNARGSTSQAGGADFTVYYPSTAALQRDFAPHFQPARVWSLGLWLPPTYLEPLTRRRWFPFRLVAALDRRVPWPPLADHTVYEFVRRA
ncbi:MAG: class I SAM-dependent methyltransferase [Anaerolineales bacterium]|nr:class I SAM-dependent methyltransferase [Anaerolineales bacterium]